MAGKGRFLARRVEIQGAKLMGGTGMEHTLVGAIWPSQRVADPKARAPAVAKSGSRLGRDAALCALGIGLMTLSAKISVPFLPVPMTLQTLAVLCLGAAYGARLAAITVVLYIAS